jgi:hypothetical protein
VRISRHSYARESQRYDGTPHPWEFKRVWHLDPSLADPENVYSSIEDAVCSARQMGDGPPGTFQTGGQSERRNML